MTAPLLHNGHMVLPDDPRVAVLIPHAQRMDYKGKSFYIVPHRLDETKVLQNLGIDAPPPILSQYQWPGPPPFDAQRITAAHITMNPDCFVLNSIGTGKTRAALYAFDYLRRIGQVKRLLVVAPLSTLRQTWEREVALYFPHLRTAVLHKGSWNKVKKAEALRRDADVYIVNHDGVKVLFAELAARKDIDMVVLDELTVYKEARSDMYKVTNKLLRHEHIKRRVGMTGTPMPNAPTDVYAQVKIISPVRCGSSFKDFRDRTMRKVSEYRYVPRADHIETVHRFMQPAVRFTRDECFDLPPCQSIDVDVEMSAEQARVYKIMHDECAAEFTTSYGTTEAVKAVNEADRINKLLQIALGFTYGAEGRVLALPCQKRLDALEKLIEDSASKVLVFTPYKASLSIIAEHLAKRWTVATVSGDVGAGQRDIIFTNFRNTPEPHVIVAHPECMSHGLTLIEASTIVWYGPPASLETFEQANGRITRPGQKHSQLIARMACSRVERAVYRRLDSRAELQGLLLELFADQEPGALIV